MNKERENTDRAATPEELAEALREAVRTTDREAHQEFMDVRDRIASFIEQGNRSPRLQRVKNILDKLLLIEKQIGAEMDPGHRAVLQDEYQKLINESFEVMPVWPPRFDKDGNFLDTSSEEEGSGAGRMRS